MLPKYKSFRSDLENLRNKINSLKDELTENVKEDKLNEKTRRYYDELVRKFETLNDSLGVLIEEPDAEPEKLNLNWDNVRYTLDGLHLYSLPSVNDGDAAEIKDLTDILNKDDNARVIWSMSRKLGKLSPVTDEIRNNGELETLTEKVESYGRLMDDYSHKLSSFDEPINYNSYEDMLVERNEQYERMQKYGREYSALTEGGYVEKLNKEYEKFKKEKNEEKLGLYEESGEYARRAYEITNKELGELEEKIKHNDLHIGEEKEYEYKQNLKIDENNKKIASFRESINEINTKLSDILNLNAEKGTKVDLDKRTIEKYRTQLPGKFDDAGMRIVISQRQKFIANHDERDELVSLKAEIDAKVEELGFGKTNPDDLRRAVNDGRIFEPYGDKLTAKDALNRIALYKATKEYIGKYKEIYKPSKAMSDSIDANVIDPYDLNHLIDKTVNSLKAEADKMLDPDPKNPELKGADVEIVKYNLRSIDRAYTEISEYHNTQDLNDEAENIFIAQARAYTEQIEELEKQNEEIREDIERNKYYTKKGEELSNKKENLIKEKEGCDEKIKEYDERIKSIDKECVEQYIAVDELKTKYNRVKRGYESSKNSYEKMCVIIEKYEDFNSAHRNIIEENRSLNKTLEIDKNGNVGKDVFASTREAMEDELRRFYNTRNCGRKENHIDSTEYKQMIAAVEDLLGEGEYRRSRPLDSRAFREKMLAVNTASSNYIRLKNQEWSRFNLFPSTQRKTRLDFAAQLRDFSADNVAAIEKQTEKVNRLNNFVKGRDINNIIKAEGSGTLIDMINKAVELKQKVANRREPVVQLEEKKLEAEKGGPEVRFN